MNATLPTPTQQGLFEASGNAVSRDTALAPAPRLISLAPMDGPVAEGWQPTLDAFMASTAGQGLRRFLHARLKARAVIYPPDPLRMLRHLQPSDVRVVILGQDPYHGPGQAEGYAFSVPVGQTIPPSLRNVLQEAARAHGAARPPHGHLQAWVDQGVMLLNTVLTVEEGCPASHAKQGWEALTDALIAQLSKTPGERVFMLWGAHAQQKAPVIDERHLVLTANHPSPLSARRGPVPFVGCGHFERANAWLQEKNQKIVRWL